MLCEDKALSVAWRTGVLQTCWLDIFRTWLHQANLQPCCQVNATNMCSAEDIYDCKVTAASTSGQVRSSLTDCSSRFRSIVPIIIFIAWLVPRLLDVFQKSLKRFKWGCHAGLSVSILDCVNLIELIACRELGAWKLLMDFPMWTSNHTPGVKYEPVHVKCWSRWMRGSLR